MLEPIAIDSARSMRLRIATRIAVDCSAEFPTTATTITPTKTSLMPKACATGSTDPTRISLTHAINTVVAASSANGRHGGDGADSPGSRSADAASAV